MLKEVRLKNWEEKQAFLKNRNVYIRETSKIIGAQIHSTNYKRKRT